MKECVFKTPRAKNVPVTLFRTPMSVTYVTATDKVDLIISSWYREWDIGHNPVVGNWKLNTSYILLLWGVIPNYLVNWMNNFRFLIFFFDTSAYHQS